MVSMPSRMVRISALEAHAEATERGDTSTSASSTLKGAICENKIIPTLYVL